MMMPRKKRRTIMLVIILSIVIVLSVIAYILYTSTDMFKSNSTLFSKYVSQLLENAQPILQEETNEIEEALNNHKISSNTNITATYHKEGNIGNEMSQLQMNIKGNIEKNTGYHYQDVKMMKDEEILAGIEYIEQENVSGIRLNGIKQYLSTNIQEQNDNPIREIYDLVNTDYKEIIKITSEEWQTLQNKYMRIIVNNMANAKYLKQKDIVLKIRGERYHTNAYSVTLTKEQFNHIYIKILEEMKQEEIILSKLENIDNVMDKYNNLLQNTNISNIQQTFINDIEDKIETIQDSNIGNEERTITIYENNGKAISLAIETEEYFIGLDILNTDKNNFINVLGNKKIDEGKKENSFDLKIERTSNENDKQIKITYNTVEEGDENANEITINQKMENATVVNNECMITRNVGTNDLTVTIKNTMEIVETFDEKEELVENENNIIIEKLTEEQAENVRNNIQNNIAGQLNKIEQVVSFQKLKDMLIEMNLLEEDLEKISNEMITEAERIRFNSDFELFEGDNINKERIIELLNLKKDNIQNITVSKYQEQTYSETEKIPLEYQVEISRDEGNTEKIERFINILNQNQYDRFSVKLQYDEETGLVNNIYITIK